MKQNASHAEWYVDSEDPERYRYWDGSAWTDSYKPALTYLAEQQALLTKRIADDTRSIRSMLSFFVVIAILGIVASIIVSYQISK